MKKEAKKVKKTMSFLRTKIPLWMVLAVLAVGLVACAAKSSAGPVEQSAAASQLLGTIVGENCDVLEVTRSSAQECVVEIEFVLSTGATWSCLYVREEATNYFRGTLGCLSHTR